MSGHFRGNWSSTSNSNQSNDNPRAAVIEAMKDELQRFYSTFVTRAHRKPRTASPDQLPVLIGAADLQVYKRDPTSSSLILCNGGLH